MDPHGADKDSARRSSLLGFIIRGCRIPYHSFGLCVCVCFFFFFGGGAILKAQATLGFQGANLNMMIMSRI